MYSFNLENIVPSGGLACLIAKATIDESNKWHRRFSWVFFLRTKDETSGILKDFIRQIENQLNQKVKSIRCDNGTKFKNMDFIEFCGSKGIKREYSNARTPQQNGVAERKNMTLIKAARTMLADSFLPNTFWAEAVSTACYALKLAELVKTLFVLQLVFFYFHSKELKSTNAGEDPTKHHVSVISTDSPYDGLSFTDLTNTNQDDSEIPALEEIYDNPTDDLPYGKKEIGTKWVFRNKKNERGVVVRNKARCETVPSCMENDEEISNYVLWENSLLSEDYKFYRTKMVSLKVGIRSMIGSLSIDCFLGLLFMFASVLVLGNPRQAVVNFLAGDYFLQDAKSGQIGATFYNKAEYVAAANCCGQVLWIQN
ncbi:putative ribonuclease H-like domain-containing protein [Tanacetum coccineum]